MSRWMMRDRGRYAAAVVAVSLAAAGCGDGDEGSDDASAGEAAADAGAEAADGEGPEDGGSSDAGDGDGSAGGGEELTAADGWNDPLDVDPPDEAGTAVVRIEGEEIALEGECTVLTSEDNYQLFSFGVTANGETEDGRALQVMAGRQIVSVDEAATSVYDYEGQEAGSFQVTVEAPEEGQMHSSVVVSPADDDSAGDHLPIVRVSEDGTYSATHDLEAMMMHETALEGPAELAGRCQDGWDAEL